jgi:NMD protein affecting ribosome stability and mRNA decay
VPDELDFTPIEMECLRCGASEPMRFAGLCNACRDTLATMFAREGRTIEVAAYEPTMHVTPNAVALKDD